MGGAKRCLIARLDNKHYVRSSEELAEARHALRGEVCSDDIEDPFAAESQAAAVFNAGFHDPSPAAGANDQLSQLFNLLQAQEIRERPEGAGHKQA